jgi:hypothetical protein
MAFRPPTKTRLTNSVPQGSGSRSPTKDGWAPHLARVSRDVGFHCSFLLTLDSSDRS